MRTTRRHTKLPGVTTALPTPLKIAPYIATSAVPPRSELGREDAIRQMAEDMREAHYREGGIDRDGLELLGYTTEQITSLAASARRRANRLAQAA